MLNAYFQNFRRIDENFDEIKILPINIGQETIEKAENFFQDLKINNLKDKLSDIIFMFQKELGQKITGKYQSSDYGRLSIITNFKLKLINKFCWKI